MNKREFVKRTIAAAAWAAVLSRPREGSGAEMSERRQPMRMGIDAVVYDERYSDARAFAVALAQQGSRLFETAQDVGGLWYRRMRREMAAGAHRLAGLTPYSDFYLLQAVAREQGLRVLYEGCHDARARSDLMHRVRAGCGSDIEAALTRSGPLWPAALGLALTHGISAESRHFEGTFPRSALRAHDHPGVLVSWLLGKI